VLEGWDVAAKFIWKSKALTKVCFFVWVATKGKIPTDGILKRRTLTVQIDTLCVWTLEEDSVNHLLGHYRLVSSLWDLAL